MNKGIPYPVRVSDAMGQVQVDLMDLSSQHVEYRGKVIRFMLSVMELFIRFHWLHLMQRKFHLHVKSCPRHFQNMDLQIDCKVTMAENSKLCIYIWTMVSYILMSIRYYLEFVKCIPEAYLEPSRTARMELFYENS